MVEHDWKKSGKNVHSLEKVFISETLTIAIDKGHKLSPEGKSRF